MIKDIDAVLHHLELDKTGRYEDGGYVIELADSDEFAKMYSHLSEVAVNKEFPNHEVNSSNNTVKTTTYFEGYVDETPFTVLLVADFKNDNYFLKIGEI